MLSREERAARAKRDVERSTLKAKQADEKLARSRARRAARGAFPSSSSSSSSSDLSEDSSVDDEFAMPSLSSLESEMALGLGFGPIEPISLEMPPLVPIASQQMPALVPIAGAFAAAPAPSMEDADPLPPLVPIQTPESAPRAAPTARNIAPLLRRFAALNPDDELIALAPTDDVFSPQRAAAIAALANGPFSDAMARYVASAPRMKPTRERPVSLMTYGGERYTLTADNKIQELARPAILGRSTIGKMVVLAHANDLS